MWRFCNDVLLEGERARQARRREHREHLNRQKALRSSWLVGSNASEAPRDTAGGEAAEKEEEEAGTTAVPRVPPPAPTAAPARARKPPQSSPSSLTLISSGILTGMPFRASARPFPTRSRLSIFLQSAPQPAGPEMLAQLGPQPRQTRKSWMHFPCASATT